MESKWCQMLRLATVDDSIATDDVLELRETQSAEVVRLHAMTFEAACELVELCPSLYRPGERQAVLLGINHRQGQTACCGQANRCHSLADWAAALAARMQLAACVAD